VPIAEPALAPLQEPALHGQVDRLGGTRTADLQRLDLRQLQRAAGGGQQRRELPSGSRQAPGHGAHPGPQVRRRGGHAGRERPRAFRREQRVSLGGCDHPAHGVPGQPGRRGECRDVPLVDRADRELRDRDTACRDVTEQGVELLAGRAVAADEDEQQRQAGDATADVRGEPEARTVGEVGVVERDQRRPVDARPLDQAQHGLEHPQPLDLRRGDDRRRAGATESGAELRREPVQLDRPRRTGRHRGCRRDERPGELQPEAERRLAAHVPAGADRDPAAGGDDAVSEVRDQRGLADPGLAGEDDDTAGSVCRRPPLPAQLGDFGRASEQACGGAVRARGGRPGVRGPGGRRRADTQLGPQPVGELTARDDRARPVAGRREAAHEIAVGGLVERRERAQPPAVPDRCREIAGLLRRGSQAVQGGDATSPVVLALGVRPDVVDPRQQLALRRRRVVERVDPRPVGAQAELGARAVQDPLPRRTPALPQRPGGGAQAGPGTRLRDVGPEAGGQRRARVGAGMQGEPAEQRSYPVAARHGERLAVQFGGEPATHPKPEHVSSVGPQDSAARVR
jgi:hypothetical protein